MKVLNIVNLKIWDRAIACCFFSISVGFLMTSVAAEHPMQTDEEAQWGDAPLMLPAGAKIAVLSGNPGADGLYTVSLKFPAHYAIPAHSHPKDEHVTVLRGTLFMGIGDKFDTKAATALRAGSFAITPAGINHYAYTKGEVFIMLHGMGPIDFKYVDPADDPRNKKSASFAHRVRRVIFDRKPSYSERGQWILCHNHQPGVRNHDYEKP